jgi:hypothetical protein
MSTLRIATVLLLLVTLTGCSAKDPPNYTPVYKYGVQDNRSTTYSYQINGEPRYTQPGVNAGKPVTLKPIPSQRGFEPYDHVAEQVYMAFNADGALPARYLTASAKDGIVILSGTVPTANDRTRAEQIARGVAGVKEIRDKIVVNKGNGQ